MKPSSIRERLHTLIDILPAVKITEIYYVLMQSYREEFKLALITNIPEEEMTDGELDLMVQQLLG